MLLAEDLWGEYWSRRQEQRQAVLQSEYFESGLNEAEKVRSLRKQNKMRRTVSISLEFDYESVNSMDRELIFHSFE